MPFVSKKEDKVMDVAKPGESKPETGSKPMVVGHKSILSDPAVRTEGAEPAVAPENKTMSTKDKVTIQPLSTAEEVKTEAEKPETDEKLELQSEENSNKEEPTEEAVSEEKSADKATEASTEEQSTEEKTSEPEPKKSDEEVAEEEERAREEKESKLQEIVKSKKYYVPIKAQSSTSVKTFFITFVVVCLLGLLVMAALIDAEIIDLGIDLPFDLL